MKRKRVLIGCEFSGIVRDTFILLGHDAWSCDLLPTGIKGPHFRMDIWRAILDYGPWDLMIFHWPCTYLCRTSQRWLWMEPGIRRESRWRKMEEHARMFRAILDFPGIPKVCGENPIPLGPARKIMGEYSQIIQPWQFGHNEQKATCLWLRGLPRLQPTKIVPGRFQRSFWMSGPDAAKERSRTLSGIAAAMARQWGGTVGGIENFQDVPSWRPGRGTKTHGFFI